jgi:undecaprenyl diphosphate synthase
MSASEASAGSHFDAATLQRLAEAGLDPVRLPRHVAVIMDGNGRWARERGLPRYEAELDFLMALLHQYLIEERAEIMEQNIRFTTIGRREGLTPEVLKELDENVRLSGPNTGLVLCLAINYGGRTEIVDAVRSIARRAVAGHIDPDGVDEQSVSDALYTAAMPDPDLLIRTAGELRVSNFLLWQISYAEMWVTERCWPDFDRGQLHQALHDYAGRVRRFGGLADD